MGASASEMLKICLDMFREHGEQVGRILRTLKKVFTEVHKFWAFIIQDMVESGYESVEYESFYYMFIKNYLINKKYSRNIVKREK